MTNQLSYVRKPGRLTCAWVPTGNSRTPLRCVWSATMPRSAASTANSPSTDEVGGIKPVCVEETTLEVPTEP
jgi:hypothetical protein